MMSKQEMKDPKNALEWTVFVFGLILVISISVYLVVQAVKHENSPPEFNISYSRESSENSVRYFITVKNEGFTTAADVLIRISFPDDSLGQEGGDLVFPFVPRKSERSGWFRVPYGKVTSAEPEFSVVSYRKP